MDLRPDTATVGKEIFQMAGSPPTGPFFAVNTPPHHIASESKNYPNAVISRLCIRQHTVNGSRSNELPMRGTDPYPCE